MPGGKSVKKQAASRTQLINSLIDKLEAKVQESQRALLKLVVNDFLDGMEKDENGDIKNTLANKRRLAMFDNVYSRFGKDNGLEVAKSIADGVGRIVDFNANYFSAFTTAAELAPINANVKQTLSAWLGVSPRGSVEPNGYLDTLIKDASVKNQIKNLVLKSVVSQAGYFETKKALQDQIEGTPDKLGALQRYYRNFAYDTFSVVDRTNGKIFADKLKFNYAIYEGGLIETSRVFCQEHNGKVYSRAEIADFQPKEAIGPGYDPFTDLGGYGCRHHLNWIPDSVAFALRPDLKGQPAAQEQQQQQAIEEPPQKKGFNFKTHDEAKAPAADMLKKLSPGLNIQSVHIAKDMPVARLNTYLNKLQELTNDYDVFQHYAERAKPVLKFESTARYYGSVSTAADGTYMVEINFGSKTDGLGARNFVKGSTEFRGKSRVDPENGDIATLVHEFGHVMSVDRQAKWSSFPEMQEFWKELKSLKRAYSTELGKLIKYDPNATPEDLIKRRAAAVELHLGDYASTNNNEFMAEAWTEYKLSSNPSKYAVKVGKLIDKYFKK